MQFGSWSDRLEVKTSADVPEQPAIPQVSQQSATTVRLEWKVGLIKKSFLWLLMLSQVLLLVWPLRAMACFPSLTTRNSPSFAWV